MARKWHETKEAGRMFFWQPPKSQLQELKNESHTKEFKQDQLQNKDKKLNACAGTKSENMVSKRQQRIARKEYNISVRREQLKELSRQMNEIIIEKKRRRETGTYVNYDSNLQQMKKSLDIDVAAEIQRLKCKNVLDLGCGKATALSQLETISDINFFGLNFKPEPEFSELKKAKIEIGKIEELTKHFQPKSMDLVLWNYGAPHSLNLQHDLRQIGAVLKFGGRLIFNIRPESASGESVMREIQAKIKKAGFKAIRIIDTIYRGYKQSIGDVEPKICELPGKAFYLQKIRW